MAFAWTLLRPAQLEKSQHLGQQQNLEKQGFDLLQKTLRKVAMVT